MKIDENLLIQALEKIRIFFGMLKRINKWEIL
jgi:hypothetical protein